MQVAAQACFLGEAVYISYAVDVARRGLEAAQLKIALGQSGGEQKGQHNASFHVYLRMRKESSMGLMRGS